MQDFIHNLKRKPEHVRKRIVLGTTSAVTGLIAIAWVGTLAATGAFTLRADGVVAEAEPAVALSSTNVKSNFSELMGAVGAVTGNSSSSIPALTIVDETSASTLESRSEAKSNSATVIHF